MQAKKRASGACHMCQGSGCAAGAARRTAPSASIAHDFGLSLLFQTSRPPARDFGWQPFFFIGCLDWVFVLLNNSKQPIQTTSSLEKKGKHADCEHNRPPLNLSQTSMAVFLTFRFSHHF